MQKTEVTQVCKKVSVPSYVHIDPRRGFIPISNLSPVVIMKKIKLRKSDTPSQAIAVLPELNDAEEREDESTELAASAAADGLPKTSDTELTFIDTMTNEELNDHIQSCLAMSSENKITPKNAFALQLIDCFQKLLQENEQDFSKMACTLDAGAKIYSYRVDALHQQVVKLADEVILHQTKQKKKEEDERGAADGKSSGSGKRKKNIIASSESLKRKLKGRDPRDRFIKVDGLPGALMSGVRRDPNDFSFTLENNTDFWPNWEQYKPIKAQGTVELPDFKIIRQAKREIDGSESNRLMLSNDNVDDVLDTASNNDCVVTPDDNEEEPELFNESATDKSDEVKSDEVEVIATAMKKLQEESQTNGSSAPSRFEAMKILFASASEYDYLDIKNSKYWAGPDFWKRSKPIGQRDDGKKSKKKKKIHKEINYDDTIQEFGVSKRATHLGIRTLINWKKKRTTYPNDLKIDLKMFLEPFHISSEFFKMEDSVEYINTSNEDTKETSSGHKNSQTSHDSSSVDPLDAGFHEGASDRGDDEDFLNSAFYDGNVIPGPSTSRMGAESGRLIKVQICSQQISTFGERSLVAPPKMVKIVPIKYSTRPVRVNMRHLKETMLEVITEDVKGDNPEETLRPTTSSEEGRPTAFFSKVLKKLPERLESRTAQDLSPAMAFLALLTLANENNLDLSNTHTDHEDVAIRFEEESQETADVE